MLQPYHIFACLCSALSLASAAVPSQSQIDEASALAKAYFDGNGPMWPKMVRFAFHYCVGDTGCNGCLNLDNPDNAGLQGIYDDLSKEYEKLSDKTNFSRADFWAFYSIKVLDFVKPANGTLDDAVFEVGRQDCSESPHESAMHHYPNPRLGWDHLKASFGMNSPFQLTSNEIVALIAGGHSAGRTNYMNSGFDGAWDETEQSIDNQFICFIFYGPYEQKLNQKGNYQYNIEGAPEMALNIDVAIFKNITVVDEETGETQERHLQNSTNNAETYEYARTLAGDHPECGHYDDIKIPNTDMTLWNDFKKAYVKMLRAGQLVEPYTPPSSTTSLASSTLILLPALLQILTR